MQQCLDQMPQLTRLALKDTNDITAPVLLYSGIQWKTVLPQITQLTGVSVVTLQGKDWLRFTPLQTISCKSLAAFISLPRAPPWLYFSS